MVCDLIYNLRFISTHDSAVLTSDYAVLLAEEFGRNPIVNDEAAFDIYPPLAPLSLYLPNLYSERPHWQSTTS